MEPQALVRRPGGEHFGDAAHASARHEFVNRPVAALLLDVRRAGVTSETSHYVTRRRRTRDAADADEGIEQIVTPPSPRAPARPQRTSRT